MLPLAISFLKKAFVRKNSICFIQAPNFCTFWRFLLVQLHCSASLLTLAIFEKQFTNFLKNPFIFSNEKNLNFLYVLRNLVYSVAFYSKFAAVSGSQNSQGFHSRNQFIFSWRNQVWNVLRFLANSVAFYSKIATFYHFSQKITNSFRKTHFFQLIKSIFARFENSYIFSGLVVQICYFYRFWKIQVFFRKTN